VVAIADRTPMFLAGATAVLEASDTDVIFTSNTDEVEDLLGKSPDAMILDARLLSLGSDLCLRAAELSIPVVLVVSRDDAEHMLPGMTEGVVGLWERDGDPSELQRIVLAALGGESMVSAELGAALLNRLSNAGDAARATMGRLTAREKEILNMMADGAGNRAIADALFISENTVRNHVRNVLDKLQARTRTEAVVRAIKTGLVRLK